MHFVNEVFAQFINLPIKRLLLGLIPIIIQNLPNTNLTLFWNSYAVDLLHGFTDNPFMTNLLELVCHPAKKSYVKISHEDEIDYIMFSLINRWDVKRLEAEHDKEILIHREDDKEIEATK
jgi:hypothetical protein